MKVIFVTIAMLFGCVLLSIATGNFIIGLSVWLIAWGIVGAILITDS
jgi:hypothetical protein